MEWTVARNQSIVEWRKKGERQQICKTEYQQVGLSRMWGNREVLLEHKICGGGNPSYVSVWTVSWEQCLSVLVGPCYTTGYLGVAFWLGGVCPSCFALSGYVTSVSPFLLNHLSWEMSYHTLFCCWLLLGGWFCMRYVDKLKHLLEVDTGWV
jgi:hypothetical protein